MTPARRPRIAICRVYDEDPGDGAYRVLVDRLWPRGVTKDRAAIDEWAKDVAPSSELRRWYQHDPSRFEEFARRYTAELTVSPAAEVITRLLETARRRRVALVTATKDVEHSGAQVLLDAMTKAG
jgi:uncharacterized protein YeaO (DUF488 family)